MSPSGKLHCVLIETFSHSSNRADWFRPISHRSVVTRLNHCPPPRQGWYNLYQLCNLPTDRKSRHFQLYLFLFIFSKLGGVQPKFSPVLIHNIESTQIKQLIVDNINVSPFLNDTMYNVSKFFRKKSFNVD